MEHKLPIYEEQRSIECDSEITVSKVRTCNRCKIELDIKEFAYANRERGWLRGRCRKCEKEVGIEKGWKVKESSLKSQRRWVEKNPEEHWFRKLAGRYLGSASKKNAQKLREKLEKQGYMCPYTGKQLILRENCSIDHILPKSRYPKKANDIDNLEFVDLYVNIAKRDQTKEEFLNMCKLIVERQEIERKDNGRITKATKSSK